MNFNACYYFTLINITNQLEAPLLALIPLGTSSLATVISNCGSSGRAEDAPIPLLRFLQFLLASFSCTFLGKVEEFVWERANYPNAGIHAAMSAF